MALFLSGGFMSINYENIIHPRKALESVKEQLFKFYEHDYGKRMRGIIEKRWNDTTFIFETPPDETKHFLEEHKDKIKNRKYRKRTELEYFDYVKKEKIIDALIYEQFKSYIEMRFHIFSEEQIKELWSKSPKELDQDKYGLFMIQNCIDKKKELVKSKQMSLIYCTIWGKRILKEYNNLSLEQLAYIFYGNKSHANTYFLKDVNNQRVTVCYVPLLRYTYIWSLDRMVLHELRHVVETNGVRSGLTNYKSGEYEMLNDIRTERNAKKDEERLSIIFSRNSDKTQSVYELLIPRTKEIIEYEDLLNIIAFTGEIESERKLLDSLDRIVKTEEQIVKMKKV